MLYFDYDFYVNHYKDIKSLNFIEACNHFLEHGLKEKRIFHSYLINFDYNFYVNHYKDIKNHDFLEASNHFLKHGTNEKRIFHSYLIYFDHKFYIEYYKDKENIKDLNFIEACNYFIKDGLKEKLLFNKNLINFDYEFYVNNNQNDENIKGLNFIEASNHFLKYGLEEKLLFNSNLINFDYEFYVNNNPTEENIKGLNFTEACNYFIEHGLERKQLFNKKLINFDYDFYVEYYKNEEKIKNLNFLEACNHFIDYGLKEKRFYNKNLEMNNISSLSKTNIKLSGYKFLHITKTGGTSVEEFGFKLGIKWGKYDKMLYNLFKNDGFWHIPVIYIPNNILTKYKWFTVVRNPYDRIISEINYLIKDNFIDQNINVNLYLFNILTKLFTYNTETKLYTINKEVNESDELMLKFHFTPQYMYTTNSNVKTLDNIKIIKFENLNNEMNNFLKENESLETFDIHEQINNNKLYTIIDLSLKNISLINEIYKRDFELFNYNFYFQ